MMVYALCPTREDAVKLQEQVDSNHGYPREGVEVGGGKHASKSEGTTLHFSDIVELEDGTFVLPIDKDVDSPRITDFKVFDGMPPDILTKTEAQLVQESFKASREAILSTRTTSKDISTK